MTPEQIRLLEHSFARVAPMAGPAAAIFYDKLFELDPALRGLFAGTDMSAQGRKLMQAIGYVVAHLRRPEVLLPALQELGRRHGSYGVRPGHYATVGQALLATLAAGLGDGFTPATREAWAAAYGVVANAMIAAAEGAARAA
jgi:hemoglobin-like flavoprotein